MDRLGIATCLLLLTAGSLPAGVGPQNTVVVVNADSFASLAVANEYVRQRGIPPGNIVELHLNQLRDFEQIGVEDFRQLILVPLLEQIKSRGLAEQIDCIAYSSDIPYAIHVGGDAGANKLPLVITPVAALNGLTFLYQQVLAKDTGYLKLDANRYAQQVIDHPRQTFTRAEEEQLGKAGALARERKWAEAAVLQAEVAKAHPRAYDVQYDLACSLARSGKADEALAALNNAVAAGFWNAGLMRDDDDLDAVKQRPEFRDLLRRIQPPPIGLKPVQGFSHASEWDGRKYLLSTMLAVTSGRGNSLDEVRAMISRCVAADGTRPAGTIYYLLNNDIRSATRRWGFQAAVDKLRELHVNAEIVAGRAAREEARRRRGDGRHRGFQLECLRQHDPAGRRLRAPDQPGRRDGAERRADADQRLPPRRRRRLSGTVTEPYAVQAKFPTPFLHVYYAQGATLAEAFYQSVAGPYQLLIIGDPLCRPWARPPAVSVSGLAAEQVVPRGDCVLRLRPGGWSAGGPLRNVRRRPAARHRRPQRVVEAGSGGVRDRLSRVTGGRRRRRRAPDAGTLRPAVLLPADSAIVGRVPAGVFNGLGPPGRDPPGHGRHAADRAEVPRTSGRHHRGFPGRVQAGHAAVGPGHGAAPTRRHPRRRRRARTRAATRSRWP